MSLVSLGDLNWDVLAKPDTMLLPGGDTTGMMLLSGGGSAANLAVWAARVGYPTTFVGKVGKDRFGEFAVQDLVAEGVIPEILWCDTHPTGAILALIDQSGQRAMLTGQGADFYLYPSELPVHTIQHNTHLHLTAWSLFTDPPRKAALRAAEIAKAAGVSISLDPGSFQMINHMGRGDFLKLVRQINPNILFPNRDEAWALSGKKDPEEMLAWFVAEFPQTLTLLKLDKDGVLVGSPTGTLHVAASSDPVLDATGAGDSFGGAFLAVYLRSGDVQKAAQCATQVAGWVISRFGARSAMDADLQQRIDPYRA